MQPSEAPGFLFDAAHDAFGIASAELAEVSRVRRLVAVRLMCPASVVELEVSRQPGSSFGAVPVGIQPEPG